VFFISSLTNGTAQIKSVRDTIKNNDEIYFNSEPNNRIYLPFGYADVSKKIVFTDKGLSSDRFDNSVSAFEAKIETLNFIPYPVKNLDFLKEYETQDSYEGLSNYKLRISSKYIQINTTRIYFISFKHRGNNLFMMSVNGNKIIDVKKVYYHYQGEMGFTYYTFFYINKKNIISLRNYEFTEDPLKVQLLEKFQINKNGKFIRYYEKNGNFKNSEEKGFVKNNKREGKWIEMKYNSNLYKLDKEKQETDYYSYMEANYNNGLQNGETKFFKLIQKFDDNGEPILSSRKKGKLVYIETYKYGELIEVKFVK
jgi:hypothetical protein